MLHRIAVHSRSICAIGPPERSHFRCCSVLSNRHRAVSALHNCCAYGRLDRESPLQVLSASLNIPRWCVQPPECRAPSGWHCFDASQYLFVAECMCLGGLLLAGDGQSMWEVQINRCREVM